MLWCDCGGFSVFILKEVGSNDSSGPNSAPYGNFWVISGALMKFMRICSWPVSKVLLKACTTCSLYGWRLRSLRRMRHTFLSDIRKAWACLHADRLRLRLMDASTWAMLSGAQTDDGRPGGFLHVTEPSSLHCLTHRWIVFGHGTSCWIHSRWNPCWVSVIDLLRINSSTAHTHSLTPQRSMLIKSEGHCLCSNTCNPWYPSREACN